MVMVQSSLNLLSSSPSMCAHVNNGNLICLCRNGFQRSAIKMLIVNHDSFTPHHLLPLSACLYLFQRSIFFYRLIGELIGGKLKKIYISGLNIKCSNLFGFMVFFSLSMKPQYYKQIDRRYKSLRSDVQCSYQSLNVIWPVSLAGKYIF